MTDTPRTWAELQTLFADNASGAISPQDLRDGFASLADPVTDSGFDSVAPPLHMRRMTYLRNNAGGLSGLSLAASGADTWTHVTNDYVFLPPDPSLGNVLASSHDPAGWHDSGYSLSGAAARSAYGIDIPSGGALTLPTGMYEATCFVILDTELDTAGTQAINVYVDQMEYGNTFSYSAGEPWIYEAYYAAQLTGAPPATPYPDYTPAGGFTRYNGSVALGSGILCNDNPDPMPFNFVLSLFNTSTTVTVVYYNIVVTQIGGARW